MYNFHNVLRDTCVFYPCVQLHVPIQTRKFTNWLVTRVVNLVYWARPGEGKRCHFWRDQWKSRSPFLPQFWQYPFIPTFCCLPIQESWSIGLRPLWKARNHLQCATPPSPVIQKSPPRQGLQSTHQWLQPRPYAKRLLKKTWNWPSWSQASFPQQIRIMNLPPSVGFQSRLPVREKLCPLALFTVSVASRWFWQTRA